MIESTESLEETLITKSRRYCLHHVHRSCSGVFISFKFKTYGQNQNNLPEYICVNLIQYFKMKFYYYIQNNNAILIQSFN